MKLFLPKKKRHIKKRLKKGIGFRPSKIMIFGENDIPAEAQMEAPIVSFDKDGFTIRPR